MHELENIEHHDVLLSMRGIVKHFPGVKALDGVGFSVCRGEVHALVGENGAGKSTLMHILAGVFRPDFGRIDFAGERDIVIANEHAAQRLGISIVFQERSLFADLSVAENIFAGRQPTRAWGHIRRSEMRSRAKRLLDQVRLRVDPKTLVSRLAPAEQQMVEIAKALSLDARLLILDEPTSALTPAESQTLFDVIEQAKGAGRAIIYISHRLDEIFRIAGRVTVLTDGRWQGTLPIEKTSPADIVLRMIGREVVEGHQTPTPKPRGDEPVLQVRGLSDAVSGVGEPSLLKDVSFSVHAGEIVAFAGLTGAGRTETALSIFGARRRASGAILVGNRPVRIHSPRDAIKAGIGYLSEDRKESGLFLEMGIAANIAAANLRSFGSWWMNRSRLREVSQSFRERLHIATASIDAPVVRLSGGNQQKVLIARWLLLNPKVLIVDEPTRGVDVGVKGEVHTLLRELANRGTAVIVVSSDMPEVLAVADRVLVMREGRIAGELDRGCASEEAILRLASSGLAA